MCFRSILLLILGLALASCNRNQEISSVNPTNWAKRAANESVLTSLESGETYLSVYSQIYSQSEHKTHDLTVTVSMRNPSPVDTLYITKAEYFDNHGVSIRTYFDSPIYLAPMETAEIIIDERDKSGGTGGNFLFDWKIKPETNTPIFEAVMISTSGQQGLSFTTRGVELN
tara:strand:- start:2303 stop:2815 length:513 start_codon:yes stop_codon:yes gene_type:complete